MDTHDYLMMQHREEGVDDISRDYSSFLSSSSPMQRRVAAAAAQLKGGSAAATNSSSGKDVGRNTPRTQQGGRIAGLNSSNIKPPPAATPTAQYPNGSKNAAPEQGGDDANTWKRLNDIRTASSREKAILLQRIEELSKELRESQSKVSQHQEVLHQYHSVFGPLHEFTTTQVRMREEIVSLHATVRQWQEKETEAKDQVKQLEKVITGLRKTQDHSSAEEKLSDLQQRLSNAHLQRESVLAEMDAVEKLVEQQNVQTKTYSNDQLLEQHQWRYRGKLAEMKLTLKSKDELVRSLTVAIEELQRVMKSSDNSAHIGEVHRRCVSCKKPQWSTPFCPTTGHRHLGFTDDVVERAVQSGDWKKLVHAATHEVSYENTKTGEVVTDLEARLKSQQVQQESSADPQALIAAAGGINVKPSNAPEIQKLLSQLREKTNECNKLKKLLKTVSETGMVGAKGVTTGSGSLAHDGYASPNARLADMESRGGGTAVGAGSATSTTMAKKPENSVTELANQAAASSVAIAIYNEDDVETETKINRLNTENSYLNKRCGELILKVAESSDTIRSLQDAIKAQMPEPKSSLEFQLKDELAAIKDELVKEQRRTLALEDQLRAQNKRLGMSNLPGRF